MLKLILDKQAKPTTAMRDKPVDIAVILVNLGTPEEPTPESVRAFLKEFLSDYRVIEIPMFLWKILLNCIILVTRPKKVAEAYASIWENGSPMRSILFEQVEKLQARFDKMNSAHNITVYPGMTYGKPSLNQQLTDLKEQGVEHFVVFPLYPQYSATSTGAVFDVVTRWTQLQRQIPNISLVKDYFAHPLYIKALADSIRRFQAEHGKPEKLLFSFHGIPQPFSDKGDPYAERCICTAQLVAEELGLNDTEWLTAFQSRFGLQEWLKPYTDATLEEWGANGVKSVQIISPAFSADCLETLEELAIENKKLFQEAGGGDYKYIPALNTDEAHMDLIEAMSRPMVDAWVQTQADWLNVTPSK